MGPVIVDPPHLSASVSLIRRVSTTTMAVRLNSERLIFPHHHPIGQHRRGIWDLRVVCRIAPLVEDRRTW